VVWQFFPESVENVGRGVMAEKVGADLPAFRRKAGGLAEKLFMRSISLQ